MNALLQSPAGAYVRHQLFSLLLELKEQIKQEPLALGTSYEP